jgi:PPOX class probable F420-dependent enzyme
MSREMSPEAARAFLAAGARTGKLGVVRLDGSPFVAPIWFVVDGDGLLVFNTGAQTIKGRAIRRDPRVTICVDDEAPPFAYVRVDGIAEISEDLDEMLPWSTAIARRYMGDDLAEAFGRRNAVAGELLVRVRPTRVVARAGIAD